MTVNVAPIINHKKQAIAACHLANKAVGEALRHAVACGEHLIVVKVDLPHGEFMPWCAANMPVKFRQCQKYMNLAEHQGILNTHCNAHLDSISISDADAIIRKKLKPKPTIEPALNKPDEAFVNKADPIIAAATKALPKDTNKRTVNAVVRGVKQLLDELHHDYVKAVESQVKEAVKEKAFNDAVNLAAKKKFDETFKEEKRLLESRLDEAERLNKLRSKQVNNFSWIMTEAEYKLVLNCLHPDREDVDKKRLNKAFQTFQKMKDYVPDKMLKTERKNFGWPNSKDKVNKGAGN